jgi:hypothetical protein
MTTEIAPAKTTAKQVQRQQQVLPLRGRMTTEKQVQRQQQIPSGDDNQKTTAKASAKATADPPASRKDDNQKSKCIDSNDSDNSNEQRQQLRQGQQRRSYAAAMQL